MNAKFYQSLQAAITQTVQGMRMGDYILGTVESDDPVSIRINQRDLITEDFLIFTDATRDYDVDIEVNHVTETRSGGNGDAEFASHDHDYKGRKKIRVYNGLHTGEVVILLRQQGAQQYCVLSRITNHSNLSGQWG
jgi:hypothetical protein